MSEDLEKKLPLTSALVYIFLSVILLWGTLFGAWWCHGYILEKRQQSAKFQLRTLHSSTKTQDCLTTAQLATLLGLPEENPNLYSIDPQEAKRRLESYPAIKSAKVMRVRPNALFVDYELRTPQFLLLDFENMAIDQEGYPFYLFPIFSPKKIPEIYLGIQTISWEPLHKNKEFTVALELAAFVEKEYPKEKRLVRIDTHAIQALQRGAQEIVLTFKEKGCLLYVRLPPQDYKRGLKRLLHLKSDKECTRVVDLRSTGFALVKEIV